MRSSQTGMLSTDDAVEIIRQETGVTYRETTVAQWAANGTIKARKFGKYWLIDEVAFRAFINSKFSDSPKV